MSRVEVPWTFVSNRQWKRAKYWTAEDIATAARYIPEGARLTTTAEVAAGQRRGAIDVEYEGRKVAWIMAGFLGFPDGEEPAGEPALVREEDRRGVWWRLPLSRRTERGESTTGAEAAPEVCPSCFMALPATGICDNC